jgi:uncharacterized protein DUF6704
MNDSAGPHADGGHGSLHGNTPAAWTAVTIILGAFTLGAIAMVLGPNWLLFWISVAIAVVGALVGKVMQLMGFGAPVHEDTGVGIDGPKAGAASSDARG